MKLRSLLENTEKTGKDASRLLLVLQDMFDEYYDLPYKVKVNDHLSTLEVSLLDSYQTILYSLFPAFWHISIQIKSPNFTRIIDHEGKIINHDHFKLLTNRAFHDIFNEFGWHQELLCLNLHDQSRNDILKAVLSCIRDKKVSSFEDFRLIRLSDKEPSDVQCQKIQNEFDSTIIYDLMTRHGHFVLLAKY